MPSAKRCEALPGPLAASERQYRAHDEPAVIHPAIRDVLADLHDDEQAAAGFRMIVGHSRHVASAESTARVVDAQRKGFAVRLEPNAHPALRSVLDDVRDQLAVHERSGEEVASLLRVIRKIALKQGPTGKRVLRAVGFEVPRMSDDGGHARWSFPLF